MHYLPEHKPVLLISNHSNAFMDAILMTSFLPKPSYYLARGDVFKHKIARWLLNKINTYPIYRQQEGMENMSKNDETFALCNLLLRQRKTIVIYPEAICVQERRLRKLKKGTARIAFGAEELMNYTLGVEIVPVGINYTDPKKFRSEVYLKYGPPIQVSEFIELYKTNKALAINQLTAAMDKALKELLIIIPDPKQDAMVGYLEEFHRNDRKILVPAKPFDPEQDFRCSRDLVRAVSDFASNQGDELEKWRKKVETYGSEVKAAGLRDHLLQPVHIKQMRGGLFVRDALVLLLGLPLHMAGLLFNYVPYKLTGTLAQRKVRHVEFLSSMYIGFAVLLFPLWYMMEAFLLTVIFHHGWVALVYFLLLPLSILYNIHYYPVFLRIIGRNRLLRLMANDKEKVMQWVNTRKEIQEWINGLLSKNTN
jgi:glycerol-3-phosphate O-acyltransferase / dihydroxyacetone phosphate acyltransferase